MAQIPTLSETHYHTKDGLSLPLSQWKAETLEPEAILLALHGYGDYSRGWDRPAQIWAKAGIHVYAYDQRGFGDTPQRGIWAGNDLYIDDVKTALKLLKRKHPDTPLYLIGESMGGAISILTMTSQDAPEIEGTILMAPAVLSRNLVPWYQEVGMRFLVYTLPWWKPKVRFNIHPSDNIEMLKSWSADPLVLKEHRIDTSWFLMNLMDQAEQRAPELKSNLLILYGEKEDIVPSYSIDQFLTSLPKGADKNWQLIKYSNGYHMLTRDLNGDQVTADIQDFIIP